MAVTAGSADKLEFCRDLGAEITINYRDEDFVARLREETGGADVIFDIMGASYLDRNIDALATDGQLVIIGMQGGVKGELNIGKLLVKRARVIGTTLRGRPVSGPNSKSEIVQAVIDVGVADDRRRPGPADHRRAHAHPAGGRSPQEAGVGEVHRKDRADGLATTAESAQRSQRAHQLVDLGHRRVVRQPDGHRAADVVDAQHIEHA